LGAVFSGRSYFRTRIRGLTSPLSVCIITHRTPLGYNRRMSRPKPKGELAAQARQRKFERLRGLTIPEDALPGSLALTYRRCGKKTCHCTQGKGHPLWTLTFMVEGKKHVEWIPAEWVEEVRQRVEQGRAFKEAIAEIFVANAQLLAEERKQRR